MDSFRKIPNNTKRLQFDRKCLTWLSIHYYKKLTKCSFQSGLLPEIKIHVRQRSKLL